jgi:uncharacterized membrane protein YhiD involved in acid resistance
LDNEPAMNTIQQTLASQGLAIIYQPQEILLNIALAFVLGMVISYIYKTTHKGLSYSQSFMLTLVFVTLIVSMVMMVIGNNLARAFALVGALSIIRFRTVVKDTKDTAYVFMALAGGMAAGTSSYFLAFVGTIVFTVVAYVLSLTNYGAFYKSEFILRFRVSRDVQEAAYGDIIRQFAKSATLLHLEPSGDQQTNKLTFDILMKRDADPGALSNAVAGVAGISEVRLIASKTDIDY